MQTSFYFVRSSTDVTTFYRVSETAGRYTCECKGFTYRQRDCRHIEQVRRGCGLLAQPKRRPALEERTVTVSAEMRDRLALLEV